MYRRMAQMEIASVITDPGANTGLLNTASQNPISENATPLIAGISTPGENNRRLSFCPKSPVRFLPIALVEFRACVSTWRW